MVLFMIVMMINVIDWSPREQNDDNSNDKTAQCWIFIRVGQVEANSFGQLLTWAAVIQFIFSRHEWIVPDDYDYQSVTSRLETSRYRDFSQFFESIDLGLENFGLKKSLGIGLENFGLKKSLSNDLKKFVLENFGLQKLWTW